MVCGASIDKWSRRRCDDNPPPPQFRAALTILTLGEAALFAECAPIRSIVRDRLTTAVVASFRLSPAIALTPKAIQEKILNSEISAKFAAFAAALMLSSLLIAGVACMFNVSVEQHTAGIGESGQRQMRMPPGGRHLLPMRSILATLMSITEN
jgi:hypothetical protein